MTHADHLDDRAGRRRTARTLIAVSLGLAALQTAAQHMPPTSDRGAGTAIPRSPAAAQAWRAIPASPASASMSPPPSRTIKSSTAPPADTFDPSFSLRMLDNDILAFSMVFAKHQHTSASSRAALQSVVVDIWPDTAEEIGQGVVDVFTLGQGRRAGGVVRRQRTVLFLGFASGGEVTTSGITSLPCGFRLAFPKPTAPECQPVARH